VSPDRLRPYAGHVSTVGICEDDVRILGVLQEALTREGHRCLTVRTGSEAVAQWSDRGDLDVIVLDIGLPDADGRDVCQALRTAGQHAPVLFLTARSALTDLVSGYAAGGDDYVAKPFALKEVLLRVEALTRRRPARTETSEGLRLDPSRFALRLGEDEVRLSPTEYRMFAALASHRGEIVRRRDLVAAAWPDGAYVSENTVDSYVRRIRTRLADVGANDAVVTIRGVGYVLEGSP
jgi:two-component system OmpR family response regulator